MEAILKFNFDEENDDKSRFEDAVNGTKWKLAMWELDQWLRSQYKYMPENAPEGAYDAYFKSREKLFEILNEDGLKLD